MPRAEASASMRAMREPATPRPRAEGSTNMRFSSPTWRRYVGGVSALLRGSVSSGSVGMHRVADHVAECVVQEVSAVAGGEGTGRFEEGVTHDRIARPLFAEQHAAYERLFVASAP